jgi:CRISPR/Cas system CMR subunit Cmr4 (Cas7 group RAMP superfamily)
VGTGKISMTSDSAVMRDTNGLPYIPGTTLAGVLRHSLAESSSDKNPDLVDSLFGYQKGNKGHGSTLICSSALMIGANGKVLDGLKNVEWQDPFYAQFRNLPIRQHVRINEKGHAAKGGKFDEEIVYKGTRFVFEIEVLSIDEKVAEFVKQKLLPLLSSTTFRLGGGTRKGFGEISVVSIKGRYYNLTNADELNAYLSKSASLADSFDGEEVTEISDPSNSDWTLYELSLKPKDFFLFGSGFSDEEADMTPVKEHIVVWNEGKPSIKEYEILIPAASVKGALAHRTAFYYNKEIEMYAESDNKPKTNAAVEALFGSEQNKTRGNVIFSDVYLSGQSEKLFNHVAIDRFTGGAMDGALYNEKAIYTDKKELTLKIYVKTKDADDKSIKAFEAAINDLCEGYLPLGGCSNHGHGIFTGTLNKSANNGTTGK